MSDLVASLTPGARAIDTDSVVSPETARALKADGYAGVVRYLSRVSPQNPGDLSVREITDIRGAGLALATVQHFGLPGKWWPSGTLGAERGAMAATNARTLALPPGTMIAVDLEAPAPGATADELFAYENAWSGQVENAGYQAVAYIGNPLPALTGEELFVRIRAQCYWRAAGNVPEVFRRGYAMRQSLPKWFAGLVIDENVIAPDALGGAPQWWMPA